VVVCGNVVPLACAALLLLAAGVAVRRTGTAAEHVVAVDPDRGRASLERGRSQMGPMWSNRTSRVSQSIDHLLLDHTAACRTAGRLRPVKQGLYPAWAKRKPTENCLPHVPGHSTTRTSNPCRCRAEMRPRGVRVPRCVVGSEGQIRVLCRMSSTRCSSCCDHAVAMINWCCLRAMTDCGPS